MIKLFLMLAILASSARAEVVEAFDIRTEVTTDTPSCAVIRQRMLQSTKLFNEWHKLSDDLIGDFSSKHKQRNLIAVLDRLMSVEGLSPNEDIDLYVQWKIPTNISNIDWKSLVIDLQTPRDVWISPIEQMPSRFEVSQLNEYLQFHMKLNSTEFCLGNKTLLLQFGEGFEAPYDSITKIEAQFSADLNDIRNRSFSFNGEVR